MKQSSDSVVAVVMLLDIQNLKYGSAERVSDMHCVKTFLFKVISGSHQRWPYKTTEVIPDQLSLLKSDTSASYIHYTNHLTDTVL